MTFNRFRLGWAVNFVKYPAITISLIVLPKKFISKKMTSLASNSHQFASRTTGK